MNMQTAHSLVQSIQQRCVHLARRTRRCAGIVCMLVVLLLSGPLAQLGQGVFNPAIAHAQAHGDAGTPNRFDPGTDATSTSHQSVSKPSSGGQALPPGTLRRNIHMPMQPGTIALHPSQPAHFVGSDGQLEVTVPAGAVSEADLAQAGGALNLQITQIAPASGSNAGGSGHVTFGTYLLQVVNASGARVGLGLRQPVTLALHYGDKGSAVDVAHAIAVFNAALPAGMSLAPAAVSTAAVSTGSAASLGLGHYATQATQLDAKRHTLSVKAALTGSTTTSFNTDSPIAAFGKPDPFNVSLSAGALTFDQPVDVPAGPDGFAPPVSLRYSSELVSEQHNPQAAAPWVGEGWNMSLGEISWAEHNATANCISTCGNTWESSWQLSDPFGTAAELIPPNINVSTYYDDTSNVYYNGQYAWQTAWPNGITWHTAPESHARIVSYVGPNTLPTMPARPPCFRVYLTNGFMEEFGCTPDSLEYYYMPSNLNSYYVAEWLLDLITDPQGNQIHATYQTDTAQYKGANYTRDVQLATIEYDSPGCRNAQTMCTGSAWQPLMRVNFAAGHNPAHRTAYANTNTCQSAANMRCDDPSDLASSGGVPGPEIQSTFSLNDIQVQVRGSGTAGWNTLRDYQLWYEIAGPSTITDPVSGLKESVAGIYDLTRITQLGSDGTTSLPSRSFSYEGHGQIWQDSVYIPTPSTNCGWTWNKGTNGTCPLWSTSYDGNSRYIASADNGLGLHQTFSWEGALNNTHGVNGGGSNASNPFYCYSSGVNGSTYPCDEASDENWSHIVLTQQDASVVRASSSGNVTVTTATSYNYTLAYPLQAQPCSDCVAGMDWGNQNDGDYLDYYNGKFMGFAQVSVSRPDGSKDVHRYFSTQGWGVYDTAQVTACTTSTPCHNAPWWNQGTLYHGHEFKVDYYDTDGTTLLGETDTAYQQTCPPAGVGGTPASSTWGNWDGKLVSMLDHNNPVVSCDIQTKQEDTYAYEGAATTLAVPHKTVSYTYDNYGRSTSATTTRSDASGTIPYKQEAESLTVLSSTAPAASQSNCCGVTWSNNAQLFFTPSAANNSVTLAFNVPTTGTYDISAVQTQAPDYGITTLAIDQSPAFSASFDGYHASSVVIAAPFTYGHQSLTSGQHTLTLTVTGKNSASANYYAGVDYFTFTLEGSPSIAVQHTDYIWYDAVGSTWNTPSSGRYLIDFPAASYTADNGNTTHFACSDVGYDGQAPLTGSQSVLTLGEATAENRYTGCGTSANGFAKSGQIRTTTGYDGYGNPTSADDPDANAGNISHQGCTLSGSTTLHSLCFTYDGTFATLGVSGKNTLNQTAAVGYSTTANGGFGLWPTSATDLNGQTSATTYDALARPTSTTLPGETSGLTTTNTSYTTWCAATGAQAPCAEVDETQRLDSTTTVTKRSFYDGWGHLIETRANAPGGQDVVRYAIYDPLGRPIFLSNAYFVTAYTGAPGAAAFASPDATQPGTSTTYTNLRQTTSKDALSHATTVTISVECGEVGDSACYEFTVTIDPLNHQQATYTDALGREIYARTDSGNSSATYAAYATIKNVYDALGNVTQIVHADSTHTTTYTYDAASRATSMTDPDRGTETYAYDQNGNLIQVVDARGSAGTTYLGYDGADRLLWRNTTNSSTGAYLTDSYDSTANGNAGVGRLTGESFSGGPNRSLSGSYSFVYDIRGRETQSTLVVGGASYALQQSYDDADNVLAQTYPDGEVVTSGYSAGWLTGLTTQQGSVLTTLVSGVTYGGAAGAAGAITGATLGGGTYAYAAAYDALMHPTDLKVTRTSDAATLFEQARTFDAAANVTNITTTLPQGTDVQAFCYDEQDRLTWAGSVGTPPCTGTALVPGTLTAAQYTQSFTYDNLDRLTSGPLGSYTYGNGAHLHVATKAGTAYTSSYDAAGNMICRAATSATTCAGSTPTGAQLTYDNEGQLSVWQNAPTSPTQTDAFLYDGDGQRIAQQTAQNGTTTTTVYVGNVEEVSTSGTTTTTTTYYYANGQRIALALNGVISYLATDGLGSATVALSASGTSQASQLYAPYGGGRYSSGVMPTSYGFTGQRADTMTGLDYYGARYYDPLLGQFGSADTVADGLNRYAYVHGNPETLTDPTGHLAGPPDDPEAWQAAWEAFVEQGWAFYQQVYTPLRIILLFIALSSPYQGPPNIPPGSMGPKPGPTPADVLGNLPDVGKYPKIRIDPPKEGSDEGNRAARRRGKQPQAPPYSRKPGKRVTRQNPGDNGVSRANPSTSTSPVTPAVTPIEPSVGYNRNWWKRIPDNLDQPSGHSSTYFPPRQQPRHTQPAQRPWWQSPWVQIPLRIVIVAAAVVACFLACEFDDWAGPAPAPVPALSFVARRLININR